MSLRCHVHDCKGTIFISNIKHFTEKDKIKFFPPRYKTSSGTIRNSERRAIKLFSRLENIFSRFGYLFSRLDYIFSSLENNFVPRLKTKVKGASWFS
jgi:hypothetical protein